jgi:putative transposon-encoded protein
MTRKKDIKIIKHSLILNKEVETFYEKIITKFGNSAKVDAPKSYIGRRAFVVVLKD